MTASPLKDAAAFRAGGVRPLYYELFVMTAAALEKTNGLPRAAAEAEARIILEKASGAEFSRIMGLMWREPAAETVVAAAGEILRRRAAFEPLQYITGEAEFYGMRFAVTRDTLIPRHDTECVVESVIASAAGLFDKIGGGGSPVRILDVGTGSGAIAVAAAKFLGRKARVTACDVSRGAIDCAARNAAANGLEGAVEFVESDLFSAFGEGARFDVIVSNPPYISETEYAGLAPEVRAEPRGALVAAGGGYEFYEKISRGAVRLLSPGGFLIFEIGSTMAAGVINISSAAGFNGHEMIYDIESRDRGIKFWR